MTTSFPGSPIAHSHIRSILGDDLSPSHRRRDVHTVSSSPAASSVSSSLDLTSVEDRYTLRTCLTLVRQIEALLIDIQAHPKPTDVPEEYIPFVPFGEEEDEDEIPTVDLIHTPPPRPIIKPSSSSTTTPQPTRSNHTITNTLSPHRRTKGGRFAEDDVFPSDDKDPFSPSALFGELNEVDDDEEEEEEDGRLTAMTAIAHGASHDPRIATIQGLMQHIDELVLPAPDASMTQPSKTVTYPSWFAPTYGQLLGRINHLWPTRRQKLRHAESESKALEFRQTLFERQRKGLDSQRFEIFLDKNLLEVRQRKAKLDEIRTMKMLEDAATDAHDETRGTSRSSSSRTPVSSSSSSSKKSLKRSKSGSTKKMMTTNAVDDDDDDDDPFASHGGSSGSVAGVRSSVPSNPAAPSSSSTHNLASSPPNERDRLERRAAHLRTLSPKSRSAYLEEESRSSGVRGGGGTSLKDRSHRPQHTKPFGYSSHKKKKIGDPIEPIERNKKYDTKPRKAPGLLEPKKQYGIPTNKDKYQQYVRQQQQQHQEHDSHTLTHQDDGHQYHDPHAQHPDYGHAHDGDSQSQSDHPLPDHESHDHNDDDDDDDDDDPFAVHDSEPRPQKKKSMNVARSSGAPPMRAFEEEKEQIEPHHMSHVDNGVDADDPFASHDPTPSVSLKRLKSSSSSKLSSSSRLTSPLVSPKSSSSRSVGFSPNTSTSKLTATNNTNTISSPTLTRRASSTLSRSSSLTHPQTQPIRHAKNGSTLSRTSLTSSKDDDPFGASSSPSSTSNLRLNDPPAHEWSSLELKLTAMQEELKQSTQLDVKQQVSEALAKLSETIHDLGSTSHDDDDGGGSISGTISESGDMSTLAWDNALNDVFAKGKRIVKSDSSKNMKSPPSSTIPPQQQQPHHPPPSTASDGLSPAAAADHARLESEKAALQEALNTLQERDTQHAKALFTLMDKLNQLNMAHEMNNNNNNNHRQPRTGRFLPVPQQRSSSYLSPHHTLRPSNSSSSLSRPPLGTPSAHGTRSLHIPSPHDIDYEASMEHGVVDGLETHPTTAEPQPFDDESHQHHPPTTGESDAASDHAARREQRLLELATELDRTQQLNDSLRSRLEAANFETAVLKRTSHAEKLYLSEQLVQQTKQQRSSEIEHQEFLQQQRQQDLRQLLTNDRELNQLRYEKRDWSLKKDQHQRETQQLQEELKLLNEENLHIQEESQKMKIRFEQLQQEQDILKQSSTTNQNQNRVGILSRFSTPNKKFVGMNSSFDSPLAVGSPASSSSSSSNPFPPGSPVSLMFDENPAGTEFFTFLANSFRGDYLRLRQDSKMTHLLQQQQQSSEPFRRHLQTSYETEEILFSDYVNKYNRRNKIQQRILLLTTNAIYNLIPKSFELRRRIPLKDLTSVSLSRLCTELIVLHHVSEHDYLLTTPKRSELIFHLQHAYKRLIMSQPTLSSSHPTSLPYEFSERLYVKDKSGQMREVQILDSQSFKLGKAFGAQGVM